MKFRLLGILTILMCCALGIACVSSPSQTVVSQPRAEVQIASGPEDEPFYDDLAGYGEWVHVKGPGWVWSPYNTPAGWRPYQLGHWVYTDYGWTWASDESYGWAVYHYGRWSNHPAYGWVWSPGTEWGPAWVAWHEGAGWVGWAPLPWNVGWRVGVGLDWGGVNVNVALGPSAWYFVQARDMVSPGLRYHVAPASRNVTLIQTTQNVTNYIYVDNRIIDRSVKVENIGRAVGHTIPRYRVRPADSPGSDPGGKVRGQEFVLFRPNPVRGAKSQGRAVPPGHDAGREPVDRGRHTGQSDELSGAEIAEEPEQSADRGRHAGRSDEAADADQGEAPRQGVDRGRHGRADEASNPDHPEEPATDSDSTHPSTTTRQRPSRYPKAADPQSRQAPQQSPAGATPRSDESPEQEAPLATPAGNRSSGRTPADRSGNAAPPAQSKPDHPGSANQDNANPPSAKPESANAPAEKPNQPKTPPAKPEQTRQQPGKSRGKKPGDSTAKPDKPKPEEKDPKGANSEESKSENADSGDKN